MYFCAGTIRPFCQKEGSMRCPDKSRTDSDSFGIIFALTQRFVHITPCLANVYALTCARHLVHGRTCVGHEPVLAFDLAGGTEGVFFIGAFVRSFVSFSDSRIRRPKFAQKFYFSEYGWVFSFILCTKKKTAHKSLHVRVQEFQVGLWNFLSRCEEEGEVAMVHIFPGKIKQILSSSEQATSPSIWQNTS